MKVSEIRIGMKVNIPTTKLGVTPVRSAIVKRTTTTFLYVVGFTNIGNKRVVILNNIELDRNGDFFYASEISLFEETKQKREIGSKVRIRTGLIANDHYDGGICFAPNMGQYRGRTATIVRIRETQFGPRYDLDLDGSSWNWSSSMLEDVEIESYECIKAFPGTNIGDVVPSSSQTPEYFTSEYFKPVVAIVDPFPIYDLQGYTLQVEDNTVNWGCKKFTKKQIGQVIKFVNEFNGMDLQIGLKYVKDYERIDVDQLQRIYDSLK